MYEGTPRLPHVRSRQDPPHTEVTSAENRSTARGSRTAQLPSNETANQRSRGLSRATKPDDAVGRRKAAKAAAPRSSRASAALACWAARQNRVSLHLRRVSTFTAIAPYSQQSNVANPCWCDLMRPTHRGLRFAVPTAHTCGLMLLNSARARNVRVGHWLKTRRLALAAAPQARFTRGEPTLFGG